MTPTQLRAYVAVVRLGSVKQAAAQLEVSESAVSLLIGQLRKEFGDQLFSRTAVGLAFTPVDDTGRLARDAETAARTRALLGALVSDEFHD